MNRMARFPVAIITGATRGIGRAIVQELSSHGVCCVMIGSSMESLQSLEMAPPHFKHSQQWHRAISIDLATWPRWTEMSGFPGFEITHVDGKVHQEPTLLSFHDYSFWRDKHNAQYDLKLLVNCAGVTQTTASIRTSTEKMQQLLNVNFMSAVSMCNMFSRRVIRTKKDLEGPAPCIVNISSILGQHQGPIVAGTSIYSASKAAILSYSKVLGVELAPLGIRVECICPGLVPGTDMIKQLDPDTQKKLQTNFELRQPITSSNIASRVWRIFNNDNQNSIWI